MIGLGPQAAAEPRGLQPRALRRWERHSARTAGGRRQCGKRGRSRASVSPPMRRRIAARRSASSWARRRRGRAHHGPVPDVSSTRRAAGWSRPRPPVVRPGEAAPRTRRGESPTPRSWRSRTPRAASSSSPVPSTRTGTTGRPTSAHTYLPFQHELLRYAATNPDRHTIPVGEAIEEFYPPDRGRADRRARRARSRSPRRLPCRCRTRPASRGSPERA